MARKRIRLRDPRTGRRTVYLGHRVKDTGKPGLDNPKEVKGITNAVIEDYKSGRISYRTAMSRLNLLKLVVKKDKKFRGKRKAYREIEQAKKRLKRMRERKR